MQVTGPVAPAPDTPVVHVRLPLAILSLFPEAPRRLDLPAGTVAEVMDGLEARFPGIRDRLCDESPAIRRHINVFVDGERLRLGSPLPAGAEVWILTAISGG